jgi:hypothetical protein
MTMRSKALTFLATLAAFISSANANFQSNVQLYLTTVNATAVGGTWQVYADDSHDNDGVAGWSLDILGSGGAVVITPGVSKGPRPTDFSNQYEDGLGGTIGFNTLVSQGNNSGTNRLSITGYQNDHYGGVPGSIADDPTIDMGILVGVGQEPSSASSQNGTQGPWDGSGTLTGIPTPVWNYTALTAVSGGAGAPSYQIAGTLIEQGTYTTTARQGFLTVEGDIGVEVLFTDDNGMNEPWDYVHQVGIAAFAITYPETISLSIPEPASLSLLGLSVGFINVLGRRARRHPHFTSHSHR